MDEFEPGNDSLRPLRGFRKRWRSGQEKSEGSHGRASRPTSEAVSEHVEFATETSLFGQSDDSLEILGWTHIPEEDVEQSCDECELESPLHDSTWEVP